MKDKLNARGQDLVHEHDRDVAAQRLPGRKIEQSLMLFVVLGEPNPIDPIKNFEIIGKVVLDFEGENERFKLYLVAAPRDVCKHVGLVNRWVVNPWHAYLLGKPSHVRALQNQDPVISWVKEILGCGLGLRNRNF